jgi:hypothetical protein
MERFMGFPAARRSVENAGEIFDVLAVCRRHEDELFICLGFEQDGVDFGLYALTTLSAPEQFRSDAQGRIVLCPLLGGVHPDLSLLVDPAVFPGSSSHSEPRARPSLLAARP